MMKIMFVGSEATPFAKTGGLADVLGSLPQAMKKLGHEISVVLPKHQKIKKDFDEALTFLDQTRVDVHTKKEYCGIQTLKRDQITYYFIDNEYYFGYRENLYGDFDDGERYGFFNHAVIKLMEVLDEYPDILHLNDWQTGLIPFIMKHSDNPKINAMKTVFTIHNIAYQGRFNKTLLPYLNVPYSNDLEFDGQINFLKTAIVNADHILTVSETYAEELQYAYYGFGMEGLLEERKDRFSGIMNGIDLDDFNPRKDPLIAANFGLQNYIKGKDENRLHLLNMFHLNDLKLPIIGIVSRLTEAKGFPLLEQAIEPFLKNNKLQLIVLGSGDQHIERFFEHLKQKYPKNIAMYFGYSDKIARQIYAGADFFLMPSRFEPCGLAQLISLRYATLPIVRKTGGLKDSIQPYNRYTDEGNGFAFENYDGEDMAHAIDCALNVYDNRQIFKIMRKRAMKEDFSWKQSALKYEALYHKLLGVK